MKRGVSLTFALLVVVAIAGCPGSESTETVTPDDRHERGAAAPIDVTQNFDDYDTVSYDPENDTVRVVSESEYRRTIPEHPPDTAVSYGTEPWEDWAEARAGNQAAQEVENRLSERLENSSSIRVNFDRSLVNSSMEVRYTTHLDRSGQEIHSPEVSFSRVVESTPRSVDVTISLAGNSFETEYVVEVEGMVIQND